MITIRITNEGNEDDAQVGVYDAQNNLKGELMLLPAQNSGHAFLIVRINAGDAITIEPLMESVAGEEVIPDPRSKGDEAKPNEPVAKVAKAK